MTKKISIIGDLIIDEDKFLKNIGTSLETPNLKGHLSETKIRIGGAGNILSSLNELGHKPYLFSIIGKDYYELVCKKLSFNGSLKKVNKNSTIKTRYWGNSYKLLQVNQNLIVSDSEKKKLIKDALGIIFKNKISKLIISDYDNIFYSSDLIKFFYKKLFTYDYKKIDIYIDSQFSSTFRNNKFNYSNYYIFNLREYKEVCRSFMIDDKLNDQSLKKIMKKLNIQNRIIVKLGSEGSLSFDGINIYESKLKNKKQIHDTSGAGDYFLAAYVSSNDNEYNKLKFSNNFAFKKIL